MAGRREKRRRRDHDSPWKGTLQHFLKAVLAFFFPTVHDAIDWGKGYESLDKEFQQIVADAKAGRGLADWLMELPAELQEGFRQELHEFEEAKHMPYVTSIERLAKRERS